jgi:hypothetical protein
MRLWEQRFGTVPWTGAWGALGSIDKVPAEQPPVPKLDEGEPGLKANDDMAAAFLIRQVHAHLHAVTVIAAGPLTNIALAIGLDPTFASDAKVFVFMGALIDTNMMAVTSNADYDSDFNLLFDPEAAHIALTAPWPKIIAIAIGNASNGVMMTRADGSDRGQEDAADRLPQQIFHRTAAVGRDGRRGRDRSFAGHEIGQCADGCQHNGRGQLRPRPHLAAGPRVEGFRVASSHDRAGDRHPALP